MKDKAIYIFAVLTSLLVAYHFFVVSSYERKLSGEKERVSELKGAVDRQNSEVDSLKKAGEIYGVMLGAAQDKNKEEREKADKTIADLKKKVISNDCASAMNELKEFTSVANEGWNDGK